MRYRDFTSQQELDAAYDVEASVTDFMVYARAYIEASEVAQRNLNCRVDVPYGPTKAEYVDIFPSARRGSPVMVFIHGGYWRMLTAKEFSFVASGFVPNDVTVVVANYEVCPKVTIPEIVRQSRAMIAWTACNIADFNGDPENITIAGHSAGGHLAAMCALTDWQNDYGLSEKTIRNVVPISGLFDLEPISHTYLQPDLRISSRAISEFSPQRLLRKTSSQMLLSYGSDDPSEFSRHSEEFLAGWRAVGNKAQYLPQLGRNHFTAITDLGEPQAPLTRAILKLMDHSSGSGGPSRASISGIDRRLFSSGVSK